MDASSRTNVPRVVLNTSALPEDLGVSLPDDDRVSLPVGPGDDTMQRVFDSAASFLNRNSKEIHLRLGDREISRSDDLATFSTALERGQIKVFVDIAEEPGLDNQELSAQSLTARHLEVEDETYDSDFETEPPTHRRHDVSVENADVDDDIDGHQIGPDVVDPGEIDNSDQSDEIEEQPRNDQGEVIDNSDQPDEIG